MYINNRVTPEKKKEEREVMQIASPLPHISEAIPLSGEDKPLVDEIVRVLKKYKAERRFGLSLLHQHFDIGSDEVLVESTDEKGRIQTIKPEKKSSLAGLPVTETSWRLDTGKPMMACVCISYADGHQHQSRG